VCSSDLKASRNIQSPYLFWILQRAFSILDDHYAMPFLNVNMLTGLPDHHL